MSKTLDKTPVKNDGPSKVKNNTFKKNTTPQDGQQQRQHRKAPGNQLKLNEFHQKVNTTHQMSYKKKMRDINRLLTKKGKDEGVDETLKNKKEEELKALKKKHKESKKKRFLIKENEHKYKKIKFFEETKLRRKLRSVQNKIKSIQEGKTTDSELTLEELQAEKQRIGDDLNYIRFYPMERKYIALFPSVDDEEAKAKRESMRKQIQETMSKKSVSVQKNLERLVNSLNEERDTKMDTFFEVAEEVQPKSQKKKIVDKQGRIIVAEDF